MTGKVTAPQWMYDRVLDDAIDSLNYWQTAPKFDYQEELDRERAKIRERTRKLASEGLVPLLKRIMTFGTAREVVRRIGERQYMYGHAEHYLPALTKNVEQLKSMKPILVGPATLDSLVNEEPSSYECISEDKWPFKYLFFEFLEPFNLGILFREEQIPVSAIKFQKIDDDSTQATKKGESSDNFTHRAILYFLQNGNLGGVTFSFNPLQTSVYRGRTSTHSFRVDLNTRTVSYRTEDDVFKAYTSLYANLFWRRIPSHTASIEEFPNHDCVSQIANLCTNIINYINASNTTIVNRSREVQVRRITDRGKRKKVREERLYYIVSVRHRTAYEQSMPTGVHWQLTERICVRGHNRHYRNEDGSLREVIWIAPHIKGPEGAPWRNQRYAIMGEKIELERRLVA